MTERFEMEVFAKVAEGLDKPLDPATQALVDEHIAEYQRQQALQRQRAAADH